MCLFNNARQNVARSSHITLCHFFNSMSSLSPSCLVFGWLLKCPPVKEQKDISLEQKVKSGSGNSRRMLTRFMRLMGISVTKRMPAIIHINPATSTPASSRINRSPSADIATHQTMNRFTFRNIMAFSNKSLSVPLGRRLRLCNLITRFFRPLYCAACFRLFFNLCLIYKVFNLSNLF